MNQNLIDKLKLIKNETLDANKKLVDSKIILDVKKIASLNKLIKKNQPKIDLYDKYTSLIQDINVAKELINFTKDEKTINEFKNLIDNNEKELIVLEKKIKILLIDKDPNDERDVIFEIKGAAGGNESKIFVGDLFRAYQKYFAKMNYLIEMIEEDISESGGYSNISFYVRGIDVYGHLKFESGVHRVQRIPITETQGRVHTSTVTVSVMPKVEDFEIEINPSDLRIDTYKSGGKGGQHANKTDSAVRITHIPTGIVAQSQDGRSQHHNKDIAFQLIKSRLYDIQLQKEILKNASNKKVMVGTGDRSEKIRTYNYPQNRITDHRIGLTLKKLDRIMDGGLDEVIDSLMVYDLKKS